ncbi:MAG: DUF4919 domain-containing protein [Winogradskyella sp.]|uniref:DUF4919 domain-containing protein n=1 Tax=Winogradskyella sp. TaxID=1883156 RepID=UPI0025F28EDD|nr:DUF4919 domain-containing protein [Winogradskyella sp.]NRB60458.1 DUF4919 domain-containing protein [Winogradskyella sp.]
MNKQCYILLIIFNFSIAFAQTETEIKIPEFDDDYSKTIQKLEDGDTDIDYKTFRESFLESEQFKVAAKKSSEFRSLKKDMYRLMSELKYDSIVMTTKKMLTIDYTSMIAHKILRQTYEVLGDTVNAKKYKTIQFGLLMSIINSGDGKSCETAWSVIQVSEEYFILDMIGVDLSEQSIDYNGGLCDKMVVKNENEEEKVYYFEISNVFKGREKLQHE